MPKKKNVVEGVTCKICDELFADKKGLSYHIKISHGVKFIDYVIKYDYDGVKPTCSCGCGGELSFFGGKFTSFISGHQSLGAKRSDETRQKISEAHTGKTNSAASNEKRSLSLKKHHEEHPEHAQKISEANKEKIVTDDTKELMSTTRKNKIATGEIVINRDKISQTVIRRYVENKTNNALGTYTSTKTNKICNFYSANDVLFMQKFDNDPDIKTWEHRFMVLECVEDGKVHRFAPDFHVERNDNKHQIVQVVATSSQKRDLIIEHCKKHGWEYVSMSLRDIV